MPYGIIYLARSPGGKGYVGQTTHSLAHRRAVHNSDNTNCRLLHRAIRKYGADNIEWRVIGKANSQAELDAMEREMIRVHGTIAPSGYNLKEGGYGGGRWTDEAKLRQRDVMNRPETKAKLVAMHAIPENKAKHRAATKAALNRPEVKAKLRAALKAANARPEVKAKIAAANARPEVKARRSAALKAALNRPEVKANLRAALKEAMNRPEVKAKISAALNRPEIKAKQSASAKAAGSRPEVKAKRSVALKAASVRPEVKARRSAASKAAWNRPGAKVRRSAINKEAQNRPEVKAKISASQKEAQNRPEVKAKNSAAHLGKLLSAAHRSAIKASRIRRIAYERGKISREEYVNGLSRNGRKDFLVQESAETRIKRSAAAFLSFN